MSTPKLRVLFACVGNPARSQMAEGFAKHLGGAHVEARRGGSRPLAPTARPAHSSHRARLTTGSVLHHRPSPHVCPARSSARPTRTSA